MTRLLLAPLALAGLLGLYAVWRHYTPSGKDWKGLLVVGFVGLVVVFGIGPNWSDIRTRASNWFLSGSGAKVDAGSDSAAVTDAAVDSALGW